MSYKSGCLICGFELSYLAQVETMQCEYCGKSFDADVRCIERHYICDRCHSLEANDVVEQFCRFTPLKNPYRIAVTLMKNPQLNMHGPEHHFLVPAALLAAWYNKHTNPVMKEAAIITARCRAEQIRGGVCGSHGTCGAAIGCGIFVSLITGATPLSREEWRLANLATAECLKVIAESGGPRCCKRDSFLAIDSAVRFVREHFDTDLPLEEGAVCEFAIMNPECLGKECIYFGNESHP